jgi:hypothetical protein
LDAVPGELLLERMPEEYLRCIMLLVNGFRHLVSGNGTFSGVPGSNR